MKIDLGNDVEGRRRMAGLFVGLLLGWLIWGARYVQAKTGKRVVLENGA